MRHDCRAQGQTGEYIFICSRCGGCYVCKHKAVYFNDSIFDKWMWKCKDRKYREVINDGRTK